MLSEKYAKTSVSKWLRFELGPEQDFLLAKWQHAEIGGGNTLIEKEQFTRNTNLN